VDVTPEVDAFAGREAVFEFALQNGSKVDRRDIEVRCLTAAGMGSVAAGESQSIEVVVPVAQRGVTRVNQFELRTRYPFGWFYSWTYVKDRSPFTLRLRRPEPEPCPPRAPRAPAPTRRREATRTSLACALTSPGSH